MYILRLQQVREIVSGPVDGNVCYAWLAAAQCRTRSLVRCGLAARGLKRMGLLLEMVREWQLGWKVRVVEWLQRAIACAFASCHPTQAKHHQVASRAIVFEQREFAMLLTKCVDELWFNADVSIRVDYA